MNNVVTLNRDESSVSKIGVRKVDASRGGHHGGLSSQWFTRPDDQRFTSLEDLIAHTKARSERSWSDNFEMRSIKVVTDREDAQKLELALPDGQIVTPNHWSFGQLCKEINFPASHYRMLPGAIAERPLQYGLLTAAKDQFQIFGSEEQEINELRAITSPKYGRVFDHDVAVAVKKVADNGEWKIPGVMDWRTGMYDPNVAVDKRNTTLYASDRDSYIFLVRDQYPIEVGKLANGDPDLLFPGFVVSNSEVGARGLVIETMYMRAICQNRNLWGVEHHSKLRIIHREGAPERFAYQALPTLEQFSTDAAQPVIAKVNAAKGLIVAKNDEERKEFYSKLDLSKKAIENIMGYTMDTEGKPAESVWDFVQSVTAFARNIGHQDDRFDLERRAGRLMDKVAA